MNTPQEHYNNFLGPIYSWMTGDTDSALERNRRFFRQLALDSIPKGLAVDLGCGSGLQSIPLAEFGFSVLAVDACAVLLSELRSGAHSLPIQTIDDDLLNFTKHLEKQAQLVICMGATLTHLESLDAVQTLMAKVSESLVEEGLLVLTFRDYASVELHGQQRFIPVRSDDTKILTCFLEYHEDFVQVHDLLHQKEGVRWPLTVSSYRKLRLDKHWLIQQMHELGLSVIRDTVEGGMVSLVTKKVKSLY